MWHFADCRTGTVPDVGRCAVHQTGCIMPGQGQSGASGRRKNTKKSGRAGIPGGVPAFSVRKDWNEDLQELMAKGGEKTADAVGKVWEIIRLFFLLSQG